MVQTSRGSRGDKASSSNIEKPVSEKQDEWVRSACNMCFNACGIKVRVVNGVAVRISGDSDNPHTRGKICAKGLAGLMSLYDPYRVKTPLKRTNPQKGLGVDPKWVEISWEEALATVAERLSKVRSDDPRKLVLLQWDLGPYGVPVVPAFMSAFGTANLIRGGSAFFCGQAMHPVAFLAHGTFFMDPDISKCNYLILMGSQLGFMVGSNATMLTQKMADARMRGMKLVVVDPVCVPAASKADEWVPIRPGTDGALALGMLNVLLNELGIYDAEFLKKRTNGPYLIGPDGKYVRDRDTGKPLVWDSADGKTKTFDAAAIGDYALEGSYMVDGKPCQPSFQLLKDHVRKYDPDYVSTITTVPAATVRKIAREFAEAASIGSKIVIDGKELPYRPAAVNFNRGSTAHKDAFLTGMAIHLLNIVVGAIEVPGGILGCGSLMLEHEETRLSWMPKESSDGLLVPGIRFPFAFPYPARKARPPETVHLMELCPVAIFTEGFAFAGVKVPYEPEMVLHCRNNFLKSGGDPQRTAAWLGRIPFMASVAREIDETVEFADIVFPDTHYLERLEPMPNLDIEFTEVGPGDWMYELRQPAVSPPPNVRSWVEIVLELSERIGILPDIHNLLNMINRWEEPYRLDPSKSYTWEELVSRQLEWTFGQDLRWFKEHGFVRWPKTVEEAYPGAFVKARIPIYLEHFLAAGEDVRSVTEAMGLSWDTSGYRPLLEWRPCLEHRQGSSERDLYVVNYKLSTHTFSYSLQNPWLQELSERIPDAYFILINRETATRTGIGDGDLIWVESEDGLRVRGRAKVTEGIHPEVLGIAGNFGHWAGGRPVAKDKGIHFNGLLPLTPDRIDPVSAAIDCCLKVKAYKDPRERENASG